MKCPPKKMAVVESWPWLFKGWIVQLVFLILIRWIVIYPVDSTIERLNNRGLAVSGGSTVPQL